ncbi:MAG: selenoneine biosynthesis selenosugar synthase SenB [Verrucomicrobiales bacterium]
MEIFILTPESTLERTGNRGTAGQWAAMLGEMGHAVGVGTELPDRSLDLVVALHGEKTALATATRKHRHPGENLVLALTGTDIYPEPSDATLASMKRADAIVALQPKAVEKVPEPLRRKTFVIVQSAERIAERPPPAEDRFEVCVVGHLRDVKDPLLAARASRLLPADSRIRVRHAGGILEAKYEELVEAEERRNPRYHWLGELSASETAELLASCQVMVLTSRSEGGARVVGEALVHGTPVLSTHVDGVVGLLGDDYPGFFPVGDSEALADLLRRCETDPEFYEALRDRGRSLAGQFAPETEKQSLGRMLASLFATENTAAS